MFLLDFLYQPFGRRLDEVEYMLEACRPTVERIRDLPLGPIRGKVEEWPSLGTALLAEGSHRPVVLLVHRQDVVEALAVVQRYPSRPLCAEVQTPRACAPLSSLVGWVPDVPRPGSCGVYEDRVLQPLAP